MTPKIKLWLGINLILVALLAGSFLIEPSETTNETADISFALPNPETADRLVFGPTELVKKGEEWIVNNSFPADPVMLNELFTILQNIDVRRRISEGESPAAVEKLTAENNEVRVWSAGEEVLNFRISGEELVSYAGRENGEVYEVYVPGFDVVLHDVFRLKPYDWKNKTVIEVRWPGLRSLSVGYPKAEESGFVLQFDGQQFYNIEGIKNLDSALVFNYLSAFSSIRVFEFSDDSARKDSLKNALPDCIISAEAVIPSESETLRVFADGKRLWALVESTDELALLQPSYFSRFMLQRKEFEKKP